MNRSRALLVLAVVVAVAVGQLSGAGRAYATSPTLTFTELAGASLTGVSLGSVAWGDYDSDGDLDILLTGYTTSGPVSEIYENKGGGTFTEDTAADNGLAGVDYGSVAWGDYNSDGKPDILLTGLNGSLIVSKIYKNNGNGTFSETPFTLGGGLTGVYRSSVAWGDYNSDGKPDILLTGQSGGGFVSKIYKNNGDGTFSEIPFTVGGGLTGVDWGSVAWGDYNSDGKPDILLTGYEGSGWVSEIYKNNGDGTFTEDTDADSGLTDVYYSSVAWCDYDSDGDLDILLTGWNGSEPVSELYKNNGSSTFHKETIAAENLAGVHSGSVAWGDYNSDGKPDILLTGWDDSNDSVAKIYANNSGTFIEDDTAESVLAGVHDSSVAWGDYNADLKPDILLTGMNDDPLDPSPVSSVYFRDDTATADTAPSAPASLTASPTSGSEVTLSWDAASDAEQANGAGLTYNVRVGTASGASSVVSPMALASGTRLVPQYGNAGERTSYTLTGLTPGATYYWSVQAIDSSFVGSGFATEGSFTMAPVFAFSSANYSVNEAGGTATVTITRAGLTSGSDSVHFATANGTATAGSDYTAVDQTVSFATGETSKTVTVPITDDSLVESSETISLELSGASLGATLGDPHTATLTIVDNDRTFAFSSAGYSVNEGDGTATVTINRAGLTSASDSVRFATANGTATASSDYTAVDQTVSFAAGETTKTVVVPITDDSLIEGNETVQLSLSTPSTGATLGSPSTTTLTIVDNDRAFAFSSAGYSVNEGDGTATVTINRTGLTSGSDSVQFATANGTATAGSDYTAVNQTVSFGAGEMQKTVSIPITDDSRVESSETVLLSLSSPSTGATLGSPSSATLTIADNDVAPPPPVAKGKIASAKLSKKSFPSAQAGKVKLTCKFSPKSKVFRYVLSIKKGKKWTNVKSVKKTGFYKVKYTITVKKLFAGKAVKRGKYRLKLSADKNSKTLGFKVI